MEAEVGRHRLKLDKFDDQGPEPPELALGLASRTRGERPERGTCHAVEVVSCRKCRSLVKFGRNLPQFDAENPDIEVPAAPGGPRGGPGPRSSALLRPRCIVKGAAKRGVLETRPSLTSPLNDHSFASLLTTSSS